MSLPDHFHSYSNFESALSLFGVDAEGSMGNCPEPLLGNELAGFPANAIGLVFYAYQGGLQMLDKLLLTLGKPAGFFL